MFKNRHLIIEGITNKKTAHINCGQLYTYDGLLDLIILTSTNHEGCNIHERKLLLRLF